MGHTQPQPNTTLPFTTSDPARAILLDLPSPLQPHAWSVLLQNYPGDLGLSIKNILLHGVLIGYEGPDQVRLSRNLASAQNDQETITVKLKEDLHLRRVLPIQPIYPFISSPLGLVPKSSGGLRRIHHLSHPKLHSVNDHIPHAFAAIKYITVDTVFRLVITGGRHYQIVKKDIKDAFRIVLITPY